MFLRLRLLRIPLHMPSTSFCSSLAAHKPLSETDLVVSSKAKNRLKDILETGERLRIEVDGGGCSGFEYKIKVDSCLNADDRVWKRDELEVVVDELSLGYMKGATLDYAEDLMKASFRIINNPVAEKGCSCGSSFALKMD
ncbi:unnamed protein product [Auanema sp. JU1783]|nr:unnamed protein product [Auanema sp. JU1783]